MKFLHKTTPSGQRITRWLENAVWTEHFQRGEFTMSDYWSDGTWKDIP